MPSIMHRSLSHKIAFHAAIIFSLLSIATLFLIAGFAPSTFSQNANAGSAFLTTIQSARFVAWVIAGQCLAFICALICGLIAHRQLAGLRHLSVTAESLVASGFDAAPKLEAEGPPEMVKLTHSYNSMRDQIQGLLRNMREIMDHIAHDILTPVTRLRCHAEIQLHRPGNPAQVDETCGHVVEECDHILNLVNSVLKISAVESGLKTWEWEALDLVSLIEDGCDLFTPVIDHKDQNLEVDLPQECIVRGDRSALQRLIANLLDNAIKYTPPGGQLHVGLNRDGSQVYLSFTNTGDGIDESDRQLIFQRFYRGDRSRSKPGHGLGLSYCSLVAKAMGGDIQLASQRDQDTTFTVTIPLEEQVA